MLPIRRGGSGEMMEHHLTGWEMVYLLKGGRLTLIKNILSICLLIVYPFSPSSFVLLIELRNFYRIFIRLS